MNNNERYDDAEEAFRSSFEGQQAGIWTALPAIITSFDPIKLTCEARPTIMGKITQKDSSVIDKELPLLVDVPVQFPQGGGFVLTFPLAPGDEVLIVFASRCIDSWWQSGDVSPAAEFRMHDLSDGFAIPGVRSQARKIEGVALDSVQLRLDDGTAYISLSTEGAVTIDAPAGVGIIGDMNITGVVNITGTILVNGVDIGELHKHAGGTISGKTGPIVP